MDGDGRTDNVTVAVLLQDATLLPVTVYIVVDEGPAVTPEPVVAVNPEEGDQE